MFTELVPVIDHFDIPSKIIGQTYDGAPVMSSMNNGLMAKVCNLYGDLEYFHRIAHKLNPIPGILLQEMATLVHFRRNN